MSDFPLFLHATGQWAKCVRGTFFYFGKDKAEALREWARQKEAILSGRKVYSGKESLGLTVRELANSFLSAKRTLMDSGELSPVTWRHYEMTCRLFTVYVGGSRVVDDISTDDFQNFRAEMAKTRGAHAMAGVIQRVRTLFKFAWDDGLIEKPVRFGTAFRKPSKKVMREARNRTGLRMLEATEIQTVLKAATVPMRAMILLGLNCGFGQTDIASLPKSAVNLKTGWVEFPRTKTAIPRRCPLWPETVRAVRAAIASRPEPTDHADSGLVFITKYGKRWVRLHNHPGRVGVLVDSVRLEFDKLLTGAGLKRKGLSFYALRHTFRTVADECLDEPAIDLIMGHVDESMADNYRQRIGDLRLKAVCDHVRDWLRRTRRSSSASSTS